MLVQAFTGLPGGGENVTAGVVDGLAGMAQFFDHLAPGLGHMLQRLHQAGAENIAGGFAGHQRNTQISHG